MHFKASFVVGTSRNQIDCGPSAKSRNLKTEFWMLWSIGRVLWLISLCFIFFPNSIFTKKKKILLDSGL